MRRVHIAFLVVLVASAVSVGSGQTVTMLDSARLSLPEVSRESLPTRLRLYIRAFNTGDMNHLFDLTSERARRGMSRDEFIHTAKVDAKAERILKFQIQTVRQADKSDYIDEPEPGTGEGVKWFVSGCARVSIEGSKARKLEQGFDVWLVGGEWFVRRGGLRIDGGYRECSFK